MQPSKEFIDNWTNKLKVKSYTVPKKNCVNKHIMVRQGTYHGTTHYKCKNCDYVELD